MKYFNVLKSVTNITSVLLITISSMGSALLIPQVALATPSAAYTKVPFNSTELTANWSADRTTPSGGYISTTFGGLNNVLAVSVDNTKASTAVGFNRTEGVQRQIPASDTIKADLYVDSAWLNPRTDVRAGLWGVGKDRSNEISAYPIIEFTTTGDNNHTGWRVFDGVKGGWTNLPGVNYSVNSWNTLEISLNKITHQFNLNINGTLATSNAADTTTNIGAVILNDYNYATQAANNYSVHWSNFAYGNFNPVVPTVTTITGDTASAEKYAWLVVQPRHNHSYAFRIHDRST